jgi:NAD(P)-dependent dehydrogenase (short-subunit alcohol dehydrogenase family)
VGLLLQTPRARLRRLVRPTTDATTSPLAGRTVLVTGASSGIGEATAYAAARRGAHVLLLARRADELERVRARIVADGGRATTYACDLTDLDAVDAVAAEVLAAHGRVDYLVNNAGRSIRRSIGNSYDRFHDYQRTMQLNYFGALKLIMGFLPGMRERKTGHIINVSSIGAQTNTPRFSAYVASKSALDAFSRSIASEIVDDGVKITTVYMPLVRTPMIAPTGIYDAFPTASPDEAADLITRAMIYKPKKIATRLGTFGEVLYALAPKSVDVILNQAYKLFPESSAAKGEKREDAKVSTEGVAFAHLMRGVHW